LSLPWLQTVFLDRSNEKDFVLLTVHFKRDINKMRKLVASNRYSFPVLIDERAETAGKYCVVSYYYPLTFSIGTDGTIKKVKVGPLNELELENILNSLD